MKNPATAKIEITRVQNQTAKKEQDFLAVEEPLEISISLLEALPPVISKNIAITMRTPSRDLDLALGFLFTEGILHHMDQVESHSISNNKINLNLNSSRPIDLSKMERHSYVSSSCGVCGKASIESVRVVNTYGTKESNFQVSHAILGNFPSKLQEVQSVFEETGGLHAAALFDTSGNLIEVREDIGRHNALDKLIGWAFQNNKLPLSETILLLSGRASFELIQKASMAGIKFIMAVGAPSSLAVELAQEFDITLIGFLKERKFNLYCGEKRILI